MTPPDTASTPCPAITLVRELDTPRDRVYAAWTDAALLARWWGPHGFTTPECDLDARPGGHLRIRMRAPDGTDFRCPGLYHALDAPERLVVESAFEQTDGSIGFRVMLTVTFAALPGACTRLTLHAAPFAVGPGMDAYLAGLETGWSQSLERLGATVTQTGAWGLDAAAIAARTIAASRRMPAPPDLVFEAMTQPHHLAQWWGPNGFSTTTETLEFREGGVWHFTMHGPDGTDYPNHIRYLEIVRPHRVVFAHGTWEQELFRTTITLLPIDGETQLHWRMVFHDPAERDEKARKYGAVEGLDQNLARMRAYIASLA